MAHKMLRRPQVEEMTGLSRSSIYAMVAEGNFPKPVKIGKKAVRWTEASVQQWLDDQISAAA